MAGRGSGCQEPRRYLRPRGRGSSGSVLWLSHRARRPGARSCLSLFRYPCGCRGSFPVVADRSNEAHRELPPWAPIHFSSGRSNRAYATPRPPLGSSSRPDLEYRYYPQKAEYHYYDDEHDCDGKQAAVTHSFTSLETHPAPERAASSAEPL